MDETACKICNNKTEKLFQGKILNKHIVQYYQCTHCQFIQTEKPYWLAEAYSSAIGEQDIGLLRRNNKLVPQVVEIFQRSRINSDSKFLDYGGGMGVFVRLMRDEGYDFYLYDKYCENKFAKHFQIEELQNQHFEAITAFEVFEHLEQPKEDIKTMLQHSDMLIFSTELQPNIQFKSINDWWYFAPLGGQHIALYSKQSLEELAQQFGVYFYTNGTHIHVFSKKEIPHPFQQKKSIKNIFVRIGQKLIRIFEDKPIKRKSLISSDEEQILKKLQ